jgi:hypothetical protein
VDIRILTHQDPQPDPSSTIQPLTRAPYTGYSALDYLPGGTFANDALNVSISPNSNPRNFFYVTTLDHYNGLVKEQLNVVLQNPVVINSVDFNLHDLLLLLVLVLDLDLLLVLVLVLVLVLASTQSSSILVGDQ